MRRAFRFFIEFASELPRTKPTQRRLLAIGVFDAVDGDTARRFCTWACHARIPALSVSVGAREAVLGPLAWPDHAGCGHCARERMAAAALAHPPPENGGPQPLPGMLDATAAVLVREIRSLLRRPVRASPLVNHVLLLGSQDDGASWVTSLHAVIPLARCPVCGGAARHPSGRSKPVLLSADDAPQAVLTALAGWVDPRTGVISRLVIEKPAETGLNLPIVATAAPPHVRSENGEFKRLPIGWGKGLTLSGALLSAVGEAIERYAPSMPDPSHITWKRPAELRGEVLDPRHFALYTDEQYERAGFPYARFNARVRHPWVKGRWLDSGSPVWLPAVSVFLSLTLQAQHLFCQGTSNGLAAGASFDSAALRATLELVERDAFMAAWFTQCPGRRIELDETLDPLLRRVLDGIESFGATVELYLLPTTACGTTALSLALGDGKEYPGVTIGLGTDLDARSAIRQAILELGQTGPHLRRLLRTKALLVPRKPSDVREMLDHAAYYFPLQRATTFGWLRNEDAAVALRELKPSRTKRGMANCVAQLRAAGIRVAVVDVTSPDVATGPFRVVRAFTPDLQPLSYGYGLEYQPRERIQRRGLASQVPAIHPIW